MNAPAHERMAIPARGGHFLSGRYASNPRYAFGILREKLFMPIGQQILYLFVLALPIACIAWTVTHEEIFRQPREYCVRQSKRGPLLRQKFFYLFTCEYCFSHYVTLLFLFITRFHLLYEDWRGYLIAGFSLVWVANVYMSLYVLIRTDLKKTKIAIEEMEQDIQKQQAPDAQKNSTNKKATHL